MNLQTTVMMGIEFLYCAIDIMLLSYYCEIFSKRKEKHKIYHIVFNFVFTLMLFLLTLEQFYSSFTAIFSMVVILAYGLLIFEGKWLKKAASVGLYYIILGIITLLVTATVPQLLSLNLNEMMVNIEMRALLVVITRALVFLLGYFLQKKYKETTESILNLRSLVIFFIFVFLVLIMLFEVIYLEGKIPTDQVVLSMSLTFVLGVFMIAVLFLRYLQIKEKNMHYHARLEEASHKNETYLRNAKEQMDILKIKHDLRNHLIVLDNYIKQGTQKDLEEYMHNLLQHPGLKSFVKTKNEVVNAIINYKISNHPNIIFTIRHDEGTYAIEPEKITILLGNALDNAIESTQKNENEGEIRVILSENNQFIKIFISNPIHEYPIIDKGKLVSSKASKYSGIGMLNIEQVVEELGGSVDFSIEDHRFNLTILLDKESKNDHLIKKHTI